MEGILLWAYALNSIMLINHEIDSAYQKEWELFGLPGGSGLFLMLHFPILGLVFYGFVALVQGSPPGLYVSLLLGLCGILAFCIHVFFIRTGRKEFTQQASLFILSFLLLSSIVNTVLTLSAMGA